MKKRSKLSPWITKLSRRLLNEDEEDYSIENEMELEEMKIRKDMLRRLAEKRSRKSRRLSLSLKQNTHTLTYKPLQRV